MSFKGCHNGPNKILSNNGLEISGASLFEAEDSFYKFDLVISLGIVPNPTKKKDVSKSKLRSIGLVRVIEKYIHQPEHLVLDWPDFNIPNLSKDFWVELVRVLKKKGRDRDRFNGKYKVMVHCQGGHGRTGTCLAILGTLIEGWDKDVIGKVRKLHCKNSVENKKQIGYVEKITGVECEGEGSKNYNSFSYSSNVGLSSDYDVKLTSLAPEICRVCLKDYGRGKEHIAEAIKCEEIHAEIAKAKKLATSVTTSLDKGEYKERCKKHSVRKCAHCFSEEYLADKGSLGVM